MIYDAPCFYGKGFLFLKPVKLSEYFMKIMFVSEIKNFLKKYLIFLKDGYIISLVLVRNKRRTFSSVGRAPDS